MITLMELNQAVNQTVERCIKGLFDYEIPIVAEELKEPIVRPSIKVNFENVSNGKFNSCNREKNLTCRIYFFAKNARRSKHENLIVQEAIEDAFLEGLEIKEGFIIPIESVESVTADSVLICSLDIYLIELLPDNDTNEIMEELKFRKGE